MSAHRLYPTDLIIPVGIAALLAIVVAGCDPAFDSLNARDDRVYSLYGVLDPAADTQWVRVEPLPEPTSEGTAPDLDATVTLENLDTGQTWEFHDSLMVVQTEPQHNFWTTAPIRAGTRYRVEARRSDDATTWATTTTPAQPPTIVRTADDNAKDSGILIQDAEKLAGVKARYFGIYGYVYDVSYYAATRKTSAGYLTEIRPARDIERLGILGIDSLKVIAAAGGPDWPKWENYRRTSVFDLALPDSFSNVRGGHGMVSGIYRTTTSP